MTVIGLDLDNTIIRYDHLFYRLAVEHGLIGRSTPADKTAIRDHIRKSFGDEKWQWLQSMAYGPRLPEAEIFPGVAEALLYWRERGARPKVISHKTKFSSQGGIDLRSAAVSFLKSRGLQNMFSELCFTDTAALKAEAVSRAGCLVMVDDLPEFLLRPDFPPETERILFDPAGAGHPILRTCSDWAAIVAVVDQWA